MMASAPRPSSSSLRGKRSRLLSSLSTAVCISYRLPLLFLLGPLLCLIASVANVYPEDPRAGRMLGIGSYTCTHANVFFAQGHYTLSSSHVWAWVWCIHVTDAHLSLVVRAFAQCSGLRLGGVLRSCHCQPRRCCHSYCSRRWASFHRTELQARI